MFFPYDSFTFSLFSLPDVHETVLENADDKLYGQAHEVSVIHPMFKLTEMWYTTRVKPVCKLTNN